MDEAPGGLSPGPDGGDTLLAWLMPGEEVHAADGRLLYRVLPECGSRPEITHACPVDDGGLTPCCGKTPFELPRTDRMTLDPLLVTCRAGYDQDHEQADGDGPSRPRPSPGTGA